MVDQPPPVTGRIVVLNGVPRSGKSSIARALQRHGDWLNLGVDAMLAMTPAHLLPGIGLRPGGERPDLEPVVSRHYRTLFAMIAAAARAGSDVVSDLGLHEAHGSPLGILDGAAQALAGLPVLFVGVSAPLDTIMARRNADPQGGTYATGDTVPEPVRRWQEAVTSPAGCDLTLDTSLLSPEACAQAIVAALADPPRPGALERLALR